MTIKCPKCKGTGTSLRNCNIPCGSCAGEGLIEERSKSGASSSANNTSCKSCTHALRDCRRCLSKGLI